MIGQITYSTSPKKLAHSVWRHRSLIEQMVFREIAGRYKGSIFGIGWSFFNPILMLLVYTFVFSFVFKARWGVTSIDSEVDYALLIFVGLIIHSFFAEVLYKSPNLILCNTNFVKKVVFPLEVLTIIIFCVALLHTFISLLLVIIAFALLNGYLNWSVLYTPITLFPLLPMTLGISWFLASLGVYFRDIEQVIGSILMMLLFLAPVFYPLTSLPELPKNILFLNPITLPIQETRSVMLFGDTPNWAFLSIYTVISLIICWIGFWCFQKMRRGFADVI